MASMVRNTMDAEGIGSAKGMPQGEAISQKEVSTS